MIIFFLAPSMLTVKRSVAVGFVIAGIVAASILLYFVERAPRTPWGTQTSSTQPRDLHAILARANYLYWLHNLPKATPLYTRAEELASQSHDARDALYAKIGLIRSSDAMSFPDLS